MEKKDKLTRETLKLLSDLDFKTLLVTKSDIFLRDLDILTTGKFAFTITISTHDDELAAKLEPGAPPPSRRIMAAAKLIENSIPVGIRVDPIIPGLNEDVEPLLKQLAEVGVEIITSSTYKARNDSLKRLITAFPKQKLQWEKLYLDNGQYLNRSRYLQVDERQRILKNVSLSAKKHGLKFNMCREGLTITRTAASCDGMHLLNR
jgi:DNA repair photolyase